jgi:hypothetical protein
MATGPWAKCARREFLSKALGIPRLQQLAKLMAWAHAGVRSMVIIILSVIKKRFSQINAQRRVEEVQIDGLALLKLVR